MNLNVLYFVNYFKGAFWLESNRAGTDFIRIIKNGTSFSNHVQLDTNSREEAITWFATLAAQVLTMKNISSPIIFVPVPSSDCCVSHDRYIFSTTTRLAESLSKRMRNSVVVDGLRWIGAMKPSHQGGRRDAHFLYNNLVVTKSLPHGSYVLVDDIITTGAHLRAAAAMLRDAGQPCQQAICVGKTARKTSNRAFAISEDVLHEFVSPPDRRHIRKEINSISCDAHHRRTMSV